MVFRETPRAAPAVPTVTTLRRPRSSAVHAASVVFRREAIAALDQADIPWRISFLSPSLSGLWAAVAAGLGISARVAYGLPHTLVPLINADLPLLPKLSLAPRRPIQAIGTPVRIGSCASSSFSHASTRSSSPRKRSLLRGIRKTSSRFSDDPSENGCGYDGVRATPILLSEESSEFGAKLRQLARLPRRKAFMVGPYR